MTLRALLLPAALAPLLLPAPAVAEIALGITGGALGLGPEVGWRATPVVGLRASATTLGFGAAVASDDIRYDGDVRLRSAGAMVDLYPLRSGLRVSAGARVSGNRVDIVARPARDVVVGGVRYRPDEVGTLEGEVGAARVAPVLTLGWAGGRARGFHGAVEAGALFHGRPTVRELRSTGLLAGNPVFQESLARERAQVEDDIGRFRVLPVLQLGVGWRF